MMQITNRFSSLWTTGFAVAALFVFGAQGADHHALSGRVFDSSGQPLIGAAVLINKLDSAGYIESKLTDEQGRYEFSELPNGEYSVEASCRGFVTVSVKPIRVYFPAQVQWRFDLRVADLGNEGGVYATSEVIGELISQGVRIANARICMNSINSLERPACTTTNRLGQYALSVKPGVYDVTVERPRESLTTMRLDVSTSGEYRNKIKL
jgi:hypothetical protein